MIIHIPFIENVRVKTVLLKLGELQVVVIFSEIDPSHVDLNQDGAIVHLDNSEYLSITRTSLTLTKHK